MKKIILALLVIVSVQMMGDIFVSFSYDFSEGETVSSVGMDTGEFTAGVELWDFSSICFFVGAVRNLDLGDFMFTLETRVGFSSKPYLAVVNFFWKKHEGVKWGFGYSITLKDSSIRFPLFVRLGW
ncbi:MULTISPECIES: hypothetical protein [unclassified Thermotoga]|uniref:hypothetical protein n=1 Tax=unclassified Thermotoga TaxID=2631113 RepID=UPI000280E7E3|nr:MULTISPECIES: hypothetical protein [unclassified Thermotoga]AIY87056.1 hypothetical protein T2812B_07645 [Thermotoga sp. 2812B]EJX25773.1 hypothetical protein EMP_08297 [Thermotoga sp. EMP]